MYGPTPYFPSMPAEPPKAEPIGEVTDFIENEECFKVCIIKIIFSGKLLRLKQTNLMIIFSILGGRF